MIAHETRETRQRRMAMRSWRRGTKEMDLILGPYADAHLAAMSDGDLAEYDAFLAQDDQDLYPWITGAAPAPARFADLIAAIGRHARTRQRNG